MAHFNVVVFAKEEEAVELLKQYDENLIMEDGDYNPWGKWDYYTVIGHKLPNWTPYAFVTPDGIWVGRGIISEDGYKFSEIPLYEWEIIYRSNVQKYKKCSKTVLDCHS